MGSKHADDERGVAASCRRTLDGNCLHPSHGQSRWRARIEDGQAERPQGFPGVGSTRLASGASVSESRTGSLGIALRTNRCWKTSRAESPVSLAICFRGRPSAKPSRMAASCHASMSFIGVTPSVRKLPPACSTFPDFLSAPRNLTKYRVNTAAGGGLDKP
jgi:hypothetical protein